MAGGAGRSRNPHRDDCGKVRVILTLLMCTLGMQVALWGLVCYLLIVDRDSEQMSRVLGTAALASAIWLAVYVVWAACA